MPIHQFFRTSHSVSCNLERHSRLGIWRCVAAYAVLDVSKEHLDLIFKYRVVHCPYYHCSRISLSLMMQAIYFFEIPGRTYTWRRVRSQTTDTHNYAAVRTPNLDCNRCQNVTSRKGDLAEEKVGLSKSKDRSRLFTYFLGHRCCQADRQRPHTDINCIVICCTISDVKNRIPILDKLIELSKGGKAREDVDPALEMNAILIAVSYLIKTDTWNLHRGYLISILFT